MLIIGSTGSKFETDRDIGQANLYDELDDSAFNNKDKVLQPGIRKAPESLPESDTRQPAEVAVQPMFGGIVESRDTRNGTDTETVTQREDDRESLGQTALMAVDPEQMYLL